jgi:hypothetical protein
VEAEPTVLVVQHLALVAHGAHVPPSPHMGSAVNALADALAAGIKSVGVDGDIVDLRIISRPTTARMLGMGGAAAYVVTGPPDITLTITVAVRSIDIAARIIAARIAAIKDFQEKLSGRAPAVRDSSDI